MLVDTLDFETSDIIGHLSYIYSLCIRKNVRWILELGVRNGNSSKLFLDVCQKTGGTLISVDSDQDSYVSNCYNHLFINADDRNLKFSEKFDLLFIDTSHTYEHTLDELNRFDDAVKEGGMIMLHDIFNYEHEKKVTPVYEAIQEFLKTHHYSIEYRDNSCGLAILYK